MWDNKHPLTYGKNEATKWAIPSYWDLFAVLIIVALLVFLGWGAKHMLGHFTLDEHIPISLNPWMLPGYALRSVLRMLIALVCSLIFTFVFATWAAKSKAAARVIIPLIDILQSVPVLGFLSITVVAFIVLFRGSMLGPEAASIFAIFTAQVWNMTLSLYQSLLTVPKSLHEAASMFQLSGWQRFWRVEVPFSMPGLLWNMMMSMSGSWVFLVASEAITVANHNITLPGIGSYIALAITRANGNAIYYVIVAMFCVILLYDQLLFRPLVAWSGKFKMNVSVSEEEPESWLLNLFQRTRSLKHLGKFLHHYADYIVNGKPFRKKPKRRKTKPLPRTQHLRSIIYYGAILLVVAFAMRALIQYIFNSVGIDELWHVLDLGWWTAVRVTVVIILSAIVWIPLGVLIGLHKQAAKWVQPIAQFLAAFPANLLFPIMTLLIIHNHLNVNVWTAPLMILGTQWYILFNVVAGTTALPQHLHDAAGTLRVRGWLWWKRFVLPGIFPYFITGAITAAGGAWNISIVAEALDWGQYHLRAFGLGAYLTDQYNAGHFPQLTLGIVVMSLYVLVINRVLWRPLYRMAEQRFQIR